MTARSCPILVALLTLLSPPSGLAADPTPDYYLNNGHLSVGVKCSWGGAIVYVTYNGSANMVDNGIPDTGRSVQVSLYKFGTYNGCTPCNLPSCTWDWNPVQGGNACYTGSGSVQCTSAAFTQAQPLLWNSLQGRSNVVVKQWLTLVDTNALKITYEVTNNETFTISGNRNEFPVTYLKTWLNKAQTYDGSLPFTGGAVRALSIPANSYVDVNATERWVMWTNGSTGLGLYVPPSGINEIWRVGKLSPQGTTATNYIQRWAETPLAPGAKVTFDAYLITGTLTEIRNKIYALHPTGQVVPNSSFENGSGADATSWTEGTNHARSSDRAHSGSWALKSTYTGTGGVASTAAVSVQPNTTYVFSAWIYRQSAAGNAYVDMGDIPGEVQLVSSGTTGAWQHLQSAWFSGSRTSLNVRCVTDWGPGGIVWFDDVTLEPQ